MLKKFDFLLSIVAEELRNLPIKPVFVGGSILGFYIDRPHMEPLRATFERTLQEILTG